MMTRLRAGIEHCRARSMEWMPPPAWHGQALGDLRDQRGVIALAHGGVEVDELHQRIAENFSIQYSKSSKARRSFSPCTS